MKFIPILFSTLMVQAIMEGRKSQTRRVICKDSNINNPEMVLCDITNDGVFAHFGLNPIGNPEAGFVSKYKPGDVLWVRESWAQYPHGDKEFIYKSKTDSDGEEIRQEYLKSGCAWAKWRPSIHMPKSACRIFLKVKSVRPERLQDISFLDSRAEGIERTNPKDWRFWKDYLGRRLHLVNEKESFQTLWMSINGKDSWNANPWVWVVEFERIVKPENFLS